MGTKSCMKAKQAYGRRDSNPYSFNSREILSLLRLPFRHCRIERKEAEVRLFKHKAAERASKKRGSGVKNTCRLSAAGHVSS